MITINQLAQLAASINTEITAADKVKMAWDIWHAADHMISIERGYEEEPAPAPIILPFIEYLRMVYTEGNDDDLQKYYRDYIKDEIAYYREMKEEPPYSEFEILSEYQKIIEKEKAEGVLVSEQRLRHLREHREQQKHIKYSYRGKLGAAKRAEMRVAEKARLEAENEK